MMPIITGLESHKASLSSSVVHQWPFKGGTFIVVPFVNSYIVINCLMIFFKQSCKLIIYSNKVCTFVRFALV